MDPTTDINTSLRLLGGLEDGGLAASGSRDIAEVLDPVIVAVIVRYLRNSYPAGVPAATAVLERVVALTSTMPGLIGKCKQGERDPIFEWFVDAHSFDEYRGRGRELVELIVEKLES
jgi:hypothetical protein